jgi:hypothetical protein
MFTIHKKNLNKEILSMAKLLKATYLAKSEYDTNRILTEIFSIDYTDTGNISSSKTRNSKSESGLDFKGSVPDNKKSLKEQEEDNLYSNSEHPFDAPITSRKNEAPKLNSVTNLDNNASNYINLNSSHSKNEENSNKSNVILFYNEFFTKFFANSNSQDVYQKIYDSDLVDNLLNVWEKIIYLFTYLLFIDTFSYSWLNLPSGPSPIE